MATWDSLFNLGQQQPKAVLAKFFAQFNVGPEAAFVLMQPS